MEKGKGKDDKQKPDYWINPSLKEHNPGRTRGMVIRTSGKPVAKKDDQPK